MVLDVDQVAELLRCEPTTVQEHARRGELPGLKLGRDWVFPVGALLQRLDEVALKESAKRREPVTSSAVLHDIKRQKAKRVPPALPAL
jgi:excisionase family DNA binding protein